MSFGTLSSSGKPVKLDELNWLKLFLDPKLRPEVPNEIKTLYEVARGTMVYGWFFYPLYTLGSEQIFRVIETAVREKCTNMSSPKSVNSFAGGIDWLVDKGVIPQSDAFKWHALRKLRNIASHPERQTILMPGMAVDLLQRTAERISSLFE